MRLKPLVARQGVAWMRAGLHNFFRQPLGYTAIFSTVALAGLLLSQLGVVGAFASLTLTPFATLGFMAAGRAQQAGKTVHPGHLIEPWKDARARLDLLKLGALYAMLFMGCMALASWADGGSSDRLVEQMLAQAGSASEPVQPDPATVSGALSGLLVGAMLFGALSLLFWHAPALVAWQRQPVAKSLFASAVACWRGLGAFTLMGLSWLGVMTGFMLAAQLLAALIGRPQVALLAALPAALMFTTAFYASLFRIWDDCFESSEPAANAG